MAKNKVFYGFSDFHVAFMKDTSTEGKPAYDKPIHIPGAVTWAVSPDNQEGKFEADDMDYFVSYQNSSYKGDLTMAKLPDEVLAQMMGWKIDINGALIETAEGTPKAFAAMAAINGDKKGRRVVFYNCTAGAPNIDMATSKNKEVKTQTLPVTATPIDLGIAFDGDKTIITKATLEYTPDNDGVWGSFFDSVYMPTPNTAGETED